MNVNVLPKPRDENMIRVILCLGFLSVFLNWPQISAEEITLTQETSKDSTITPNSNEVTKNVNKEDHDIILSKSNTGKTETRKEDIPLDQEHIKKTDSSKNRSQQSLEDPGIKTPYVSESLSLELDEDQKDEETNGPVNKHESKDRDDSDKNSPNSRSADTQPPQESKEKETSYMEKLSSNMLMPVLRSQNRFGKALHHTNEAFKNIGSGTYEAASGAFGFFKDAASAVIRSG